jgi:hypothetical protein
MSGIRPSLIQIIASLAMVASTWSTTFATEHPPLALAAEVGITPQSMVGADVVNHTSAVLSRFSSADAIVGDLVQTRALMHAAAAEATSLSKQVVDDPNNADLAAAYEQALAELQFQRDQLSALQTDLFDHVTEDMPDEATDRLLVWRQSSSYRVAPEFRVLEFPPDNWRLIEKALRAEARAARRDETLDDAYTDLLAGLRSNADVIAARQRLDTSLAIVEQIFDDFVSVD